MEPLVIAVDGPAGSGKSTVSRQVARSLGARYLDTGAMYRAMTWAVLRAGIDPEDADAVTGFCRVPRLTSGTNPESPSIVVDGVDVSQEIRSEEVTSAVSAVSAVPAVRELMVARQRQEVRDACESGFGIVLEGRDIGTVVLPDASVKIFLTADPEERARRRAAEHAVPQDVDATRAGLAARDAKDSGRAVSPLAKADDAVEIDSSRLTAEQVVARILALAGQAGR